MFVRKVLDWARDLLEGENEVCLEHIDLRVFMADLRSDVESSLAALKEGGRFGRFSLEEVYYNSIFYALLHRVVYFSVHDPERGLIGNDRLFYTGDDCISLVDVKFPSADIMFLKVHWRSSSLDMLDLDLTFVADIPLRFRDHLEGIKSSLAGRVQLDAEWISKGLSVVDFSLSFGSLHRGS